MPFYLPKLRFQNLRISERVKRLIARLRARLPVLAPGEKIALAAILSVLTTGAALRMWESSGVRIGPVEDWEGLRRLVVHARAEQGDPAYACAENEPAERILAAGVGPSKPRPAGSGGAGKTGGKKAPPAKPLDLNAAGEKSLLALPGVGPSTAKAIVAHRTAHGGFRTVDDLLKVKGIGPKKLDAIRPFVRVQVATDSGAVP